jgi:hypothetical protein
MTKRLAADLPGRLMITAEAVADATVLVPDGVLDSSSYLALRDVIIKAALDEPAAVIVDVTRLAVPSPSAWAVFTSARWHVGTWPDVPVMLVCAHAPGREAAVRNGVARYVPVFATTAGAIDALSPQGATRTRRRARADLTASIGSLRRARELVAECFTVWSVGDFIPVAKVIVTALVENVLQHTDSPPTVRLETDGSTVTVAVADVSHSPARLREQLGVVNIPSGLSIVAALCRAWGNAPTSSGKTVWAVIGPENRL